MASDLDFARLVSLACHDLRTPLATVQGFAQTLLRQGSQEERAARWLEMIEAASLQMAGLLDDLALAARIEAGRYEPVTREVDVGELVPGAAGGTTVVTEPEAAARALAALASAASRHGGVEAGLRAEGGRVAVEPVTADAAPVVLGEELKDMGAAVGARVLGALGASLDLEGETLWVTLPA